MSRLTFAGLVRSFRSIQRLFDSFSIGEQQRILAQLSEMSCGTVTAVTMYHEALLYSAAYPGSENVREQCEAELARVAHHVATRKGLERRRYENSGIAGAIVVAPLSLSLNKWLVHRYPSETQLSSVSVNEKVLVQTLGHLFDPVEQEMLHAGKTAWKYWSEHMSGQGRDPHRMKRWIVEMADRLPGSTSLKEFVFGQFETTTVWSTSADAPSLTSGRAAYGAPYIHEKGLERVVDLSARIGVKPKRVELTPSQQEDLVDLARGVLVTLNRETDPVTHANTRETEYYDMGRGLGIALYAMQPDMKMSLQSYIGFLVMKNHVPCAYGGGWILNKESFFGVNVLPPFRGGESAMIVADLLRLYHHAFNATAFSVDPYQIGHGNPDGIKSRSFWFYYRLGFRPVERDLAKCAREEFRKMKTESGYHSPVATLQLLSGATMRWVTDDENHEIPLTADRLGDLVTSYVNSTYEGDRQLALLESLRLLNARTGRRYAKTHAITRIVVLLHACGYLTTSTKARLRKFVEDYTMKYESERAYVALSQKHQALFARTLITYLSAEI
ncbi:MAG: hypothetical protein NTX15_11965 [Candidatus Kapabacteria bacterium]|nr:hypothetical protein [Candidatus Kapabacteria bacterium]